MSNITNAFVPQQGILEQINDPLHMLNHAIVMIEYNKDHENIKVHYEDACFLIQTAIRLLEEQAQQRKRLEHERAEYQRTHKG